VNHDHSSKGKPDPSTPHANGQAEAPASPRPAYRRVPGPNGKKVLDASGEGWGPLLHWLTSEGYSARAGAYAMQIYQCLLYHANDDARCWPSRETLMRESGQSPHRVVESIRALERLGLVKVERRRHRPHVYQLSDPRGAPGAPQGGAGRPRTRTVFKNYPQEPCSRPPQPPTGGRGGGVGGGRYHSFPEPQGRRLQAVLE
jgi:hypothetical protein